MNNCNFNALMTDWLRKVQNWIVDISCYLISFSRNSIINNTIRLVGTIWRLHNKNVAFLEWLETTQKSIFVRLSICLFAIYL